MPLLACLSLLLSLSSAQAQPNAELLLLVLSAGSDAPIPACDVTFSTDGQADTYQADSYGLLRNFYPAGELRFTVAASGIELPVSATMTSGMTTEVTVRLSTNQQLSKVATRQLPSVQVESGEPGFSLRVIDAATLNPLPGARLLLPGTLEEALTDATGLAKLPQAAANRSLLVVANGYTVLSLESVSPSAEGQPLELKLRQANDESFSTTITKNVQRGQVTAALEERRVANTVNEVLSSQEMAKSGDGDAAGALQRTTGISVVGGKYVYVRGMGERYSSSTLNNSSLPSTEPERRVVPMDLFPTGMIEKIVVNKAYSPELPGEFGGGTVQVDTIGVPEKFFAEVSVSGGMNTETTGKDGLTYDGEGSRWTGMSASSRTLPGSVQSAADAGKIVPYDSFSGRGYTPAQLERFGEAMSNVYSARQESIGPNFGGSGQVGTKTSLFGNPFGVSFSLDYSNDWQTRNQQETIYAVSSRGLEMQNDYDMVTTTNSVKLGGMLNLGYDLGEMHKIKANTFVSRLSEDEARIYQGENGDVGTSIRSTRLRYIENMLVTQQLAGSHIFEQAAFLTMRWRYTFSMAFRDEPDRRETRYDLEEAEGVWYLSDRPEGNQRVFSTLEDFNHDLGVDFLIPVSIRNPLDTTIKWGVAGIMREREVDTRRFKYIERGPLSRNRDIIRLRPEQVFTPQNIGPDGFQFEEVTRPSDNYTADQTIVAAYVMGDFKLGTKLLLSAGVRVENSVQELETYDPFSAIQRPERAELDNTDPLPALNLTWKFREAMQFRFSASRTLARPDFRELSPATFDDITGGRQVFGNPDLTRTDIYNFDVRWEWFPRETELVSAGVFYKQFIDPIETIVVPSAQLSETYENAESAFNAGLELEVRKNLDFIGEGWRYFSVASNLALIYSQVKIDDDFLTNRERPLQGQSPYTLNVQFGFDHPEFGFGANLLYNVFGKRIDSVGANRMPDTYEQPYHSLDLVLRQKFRNGVSVSLKGKNLLDSKHEYTQSDLPTRSYKDGQSYTLGIGWSF